MSDLRKAAQQALEAMDWHYRQGHSNTLGGFRLKIDEKAIRALRAALAQPEPAAPTTADFPSVIDAKKEAIGQLGYYRKMMGTAAAPTVVEPEPLFLLHTGQIDGSGEQDEWDCEADSGQRVDEFCHQHPGMTIKLYTHPPRTALTDEQILDIWKSDVCGHSERDALRFARAVIAAAEGKP